MESFELTSLQEQLKRRQRNISDLDDKLAQELTRQAVLQELYGHSNIGDSQTSKSSLNQSSISESQSSIASINSQFLKKQIRNVYAFMRETNADKEIGQNQTKTFLKDTLHNNRHAYDESQNDKQSNNAYDSISFFNKTTKDYDLTLKLHNKEEQLKIKKIEEQAKRKQQIVLILEAKEQLRLQNLQQQRLKIRQELIRQQSKSKHNPTLTKKQKVKQYGLNLQFAVNDTLKLQRNMALSRLLRQAQNGRAQTNKLIQRTRIASFK